MMCLYSWKGKVPRSYASAVHEIFAKDFLQFNDMENAHADFGEICLDVSALVFQLLLVVSVPRQSDENIARPY